MRKLAIACSGFSAAILVSVYILNIQALIPTAAFLLAAGVGLVFLRRKWMRGIELFLIFGAVGLIFFRVNYELRIKPVEDYTGIHTVTAKVIDFPQVSEEYTGVRIKLLEDDIPNVKANLYAYDDRADELRPGDIITFSAKFSFADEKFGEENKYYLANGVFLKASVKSQITISDRGRVSVLTVPKYLNRSLTDIANEIFSEESSPFVTSLMLGDKSGLYNDTAMYTALCRSGMMHTVAVSGMHIAFLVAFMQSILGKGRRSGILCIAIVWVFVLLTGSSPSAVRAGIMQTTLLSASLFSREDDAITSLCLSLCMLLVINPYSAASVGLQMSFASMLGLTVLSDRIYSAIKELYGSKELRRIKEYAIRLTSASLSALAFAIPLMAVYFGYVSVLSPLVSVLTMWAVSLCFRGSYLACILGAAYKPAGQVIAWLVNWGTKYIRWIARLVSSLPFAIVYTDNTGIIIWIIAVYLLFLTAIRMKKAGKYRLTVAAGISIVLLAAALLSNSLRGNTAYGTISVLDVGQGQCIIANCGDNTVMIDCGNTQTDKNAAQIADEYLFNNGIKDVDVLILTHFHDDHCGDVDKLMEMTDVRKLILLPTDGEDKLESKILASADMHGSRLCYVEDVFTEECGDIDITVYPPQASGSDNENCLFVLLTIGDYDLLITGDNPISTEESFAESYTLPKIETVIAGHHGSRYSSGEEYLNEIDADNAIISVGYNTYGHPTEETLERFDKCGYNVYRTDVNGTITITVGKE